MQNKEQNITPVEPASEPQEQGTVPIDFNSLIYALSAFTYYYAAIDGIQKTKSKDPSLIVTHSVEEIKVSREAFDADSSEATDLDSEAEEVI